MRHGNTMPKPVDEIIEHLPLSPRGRLAETKNTSKRLLSKRFERLSEVNESHLVIPPNYRNQYERLKERDPVKAQAFFDKWAYDPRPKPRDPFELEKRVLSRVGRSNELKRRV
jgi:hypothetical protein